MQQWMKTRVLRAAAILFSLSLMLSACTVDELPGLIGGGPSEPPVAEPTPAPDHGEEAPASEVPASEEGPGSGVCPAFPRFPDANCTGYRHTGVELWDCSNVIEQDGVMLDGCRFGPDLVVQARDVTITRSLVEGTVYATYLTDWSLGGLTLVDVEIDGGDRIVDGRSAAIGDHDYTCIRCHIHSSGRGANLGNNVHIEESYLHGWYHTEGAHQAAIGSNGGGNYTIIHNNLECESVGDACSAALAMYPDFEPIHDVLIRNNLFNTNGGYCTYGGFDRSSNVRYVDNIFGDRFHPQCGIWGPVAAFHSSNSGHEWRGNRYPDGAPVEPHADV